MVVCQTFPLGMALCPYVRYMMAARPSSCSCAAACCELEIEQHHAVRRDLLWREFLARLIDGSPLQPLHGFQGKRHACWMHGVSDAGVRTIRLATARSFFLG